MADTPSDIMGRLKSATDDLHRMAEGRELQTRLVKGELVRDLYLDFLGQMLLVHVALENRLRSSLDLHPAFGRVVRDYHWRETQLRADIAFVGGDADGFVPLPATAALVAQIEGTAETEPVGLMGMLYVLEGSSNGSKFVAAAL